MTPTPLLTIKNLTKRYRSGDSQHIVLNAIDLEVRAGEIVVVLGRSGSGKTTLLNLAGAMDLPDGGTLVFDGQDLAQLSDRQRTLFRRRRLGFVFQAYNLLPTLSVRENVALPLELNGLPLARVDPVLAVLQLEPIAERMPDQISGGEQQRTAIARAIAHAPDLIIADEPTGNLDSETGHDVIQLFEQCARNAGAALLMATHSAEMIGHADHVLELRRGRVREARG